MKRKGLTLALAGMGLAGALAGGAGIAAAATGPSTSVPGQERTSTAMPCQDDTGGGAGRARGGMMVGRDTILPTAASYLGLSESELRTQLQSGKTFADVAAAQGKSVSGLQAAVVAAVKAKVDADTSLTAQQKAAVLARVNERVATMVQTAHHVGSGLGRMHGPMGDMDDTGR